MKLSKQTLDILKNFAAIHANLCINPGKEFYSKSITNDIFAEFEGVDDFPKQVLIYNLNEFLSVVAAFGDPDIEFDDRQCVISEGKQKAKYGYADLAVLNVPKKSILSVIPAPIHTFDLSAEQLSKIQKMAGILAVGDVCFVSDGKELKARVYSATVPDGNNFEMDLGECTSEFNIHIKMDKIIKLFTGSYQVGISRTNTTAISKFTHKDITLTVCLSVEDDSKF